MKYDLEERTLKFSKDCIDICKSLKKDEINKVFIPQLLKAVSSVGANYREANDTITKKDFAHKIGICRREAKESKYWYELVKYANQHLTDKIDPLIDESLQLARIFAAISGNKKKRNIDIKENIE